MGSGGDLGNRRNAWNSAGDLCTCDAKIFEGGGGLCQCRDVIGFQDLRMFGNQVIAAANDVVHKQPTGEVRVEDGDGYPVNELLVSSLARRVKRILPPGLTRFGRECCAGPGSAVDKMAIRGEMRCGIASKHGPIQKVQVFLRIAVDNIWDTENGKV